MTGMDWLTVAAIGFVAYTFITITAEIPPFAVAAIWALWGAVTSAVVINLWEKFRKRKAGADAVTKEETLGESLADGPEISD